MTSIYLGEGLEVDSDTGELLDVEIGPDTILRLARQVADGQLQVKAWEASVGAGKAALARYAVGEQRSVVVGEELRVSWRNGRREERQDVAQLRDIIRDSEFTYGELVELAAAAKGFDLSALPEAVCAVLAPAVSVKETRGYVLVERLRKLAPVAPVRDTLLADLEASLEAVR